MRAAHGAPSVAHDVAPQVFQLVAQPHPGVDIADIHFCEIVGEEIANHKVNGSNNPDGIALVASVVERIEALPTPVAAAADAPTLAHVINGTLQIAIQNDVELVSVHVTQLRFVGLSTDAVSIQCTAKGSLASRRIYLTPVMCGASLCVLLLMFGILLCVKAPNKKTRRVSLEDEQSRELAMLASHTPWFAPKIIVRETTKLSLNPVQPVYVSPTQSPRVEVLTPACGEEDVPLVAATHGYAESRFQGFCACGNAFVPSSTYCLACAMDQAMAPVHGNDATTLPAVLPGVSPHHSGQYAAFLVPECVSSVGGTVLSTPTSPPDPVPTVIQIPSPSIGPSENAHIDVYRRFTAPT